MRIVANPLLARARRLIGDQRTRAKRDGVVLGYTLADVRQLLASTPCCEYCRLPVGWDLQLDHRTPIARSGRHELANLAVCCSRCNSIKGQLTEGEFRAVLSLIETLHPVARADLERRLLAGGRRYKARPGG